MATKRVRLLKNPKTRAEKNLKATYLRLKKATAKTPFKVVRKRGKSPNIRFSKTKSKGVYVYKLK